MVLRHSRWEGRADHRALLRGREETLSWAEAAAGEAPRWTLLRNVDCQKYFAKKLPENGGIAQPRAM